MGPLNVSQFHIEETEMTSALVAESLGPVSVHFLTKIRCCSHSRLVPAAGCLGGEEGGVLWASGSDDAG